MSKLTLALLFGGKSPEHEVSFRSAKNIYQALDPEKYSVLLIGVSYRGSWHLLSEEDFLSRSDLPASNELPMLGWVPGDSAGQFFAIQNGKKLPSVDVVFPIIHGPYGEDGTLQGVLRQLELPFVGPDVCGSAVAMDKDVAKRLLREADLLVANGQAFSLESKDALDFVGLRNQFGLPLFIKPANMGSSVGVSKVETPQEFKKAVELAFKFDTKIIIEEGIAGRELECAVMGNEVPETTRVGEVILGSEFYDYEAKYAGESDAKVLIPAPNLTEEELAKLILVARSAFKTLCCEGMARVDMFLCEDGRVYVNEVNTLPGFTSISMYPQLWQDTGIEYSQLLDHLIQLALDRHSRGQQLERARLT